MAVEASYKVGSSMLAGSDKPVHPHGSSVLDLERRERVLDNSAFKHLRVAIVEPSILECVLRGDEDRGKQQG
jgi:hypothetical protein